jgi:hypothetical protein
MSTLQKDTEIHVCFCAYLLRNSEALIYLDFDHPVLNTW